jgi:Zn-dependent peptidase ImmA (M78 family)
MAGSRIKQARLANGLTLHDLAEKMTKAGQPITKAGLSKYELSKSTPKPSFLVVLGRVLGVRPSYFSEDKTAAVEWIAFRKLSKMPQKKQEHVKAYAAHVVENQIWLQETLFPDQLPDFPERRPVATEDDAENAATELRKTWQLAEAPIDSLTGTVEDHGGVVVPCRDISRDFDGLAGRTDNGFPVAVVSTGTSDDRRRFSLAHELAHLLMLCTGLNAKDEEHLANRFASALLVPASAARSELGNKRTRLGIPELGLLKRKYGLSMQGWARRACDLKIIQASQYRSLCIIFNQKDWTKFEPYDFVGKEKPSRLEQMTLRAFSEGVISADRAEQICPGCTTKTAEVEKKPLTAADLRRMPREQRAALLSAAAAIAQEHYETDRNLTDFEAYGEDDLYDWNKSKAR